MRARAGRVEAAANSRAIPTLTQLLQTPYLARFFVTEYLLREPFLGSIQSGTLCALSPLSRNSARKSRSNLPASAEAPAWQATDHPPSHEATARRARIIRIGRIQNRCVNCDDPIMLLSQATSIHSRICWFQALRIVCSSRELNFPSFRPRIVFSAVINRSSRATEGLASPACFQSEIGTSSGSDRVADVIRQISTSCCKSNKTRTGRGLLNAPEVNGNRQMKISPNTRGHV